MRNAVSILMFLLIQATAQSQPCLPGGIVFSTQAQIDSFQFLHPNCTEVEGNVKIYDPTGLGDITNLHGLSVLMSIGGHLEIRYLDNLSDLSGLDSLSYIGNDLIIWGNSGLLNLYGLENLDSVGGNVDINHNIILENLNGLNGLKKVGGDLWIYVNWELDNVNALLELTGIGGDLKIGDNDELTSLAGLINLSSVNSKLWVIGNYKLTSLSGLDNIEPGSITDLSVSTNSSLHNCDIESICNYISHPYGTVYIANNASGCNSKQEVVAACQGVFIGENQLNEWFSITPNSFTTATTLSFRLSKPDNVQFTVYNVQSQIVYQVQERQEKGEQQIQWNAEGLPAGMYYFRIQAGDMVGGGKMVVKR
jgi:hypothetical protein